MLAAKEAEAQVAARLHDELSTAIRGLESNWTSTPIAWKCWKTSETTTAARLHTPGRPAGRLCESSQRSDQPAKLLERAEQNLTNARSDRASAKAASLITRVDAPDHGQPDPVSPGAL